MTNIDDTLIQIETYKSEIPQAVDKVKHALKWYDDFYVFSAVAAANTIYSDYIHYAEDEEKEALETFNKLIESTTAVKTYSYVAKFGDAVIKELDHKLISESNNVTEYARYLTKYFKQFCKFVVYNANPSSRTVQGNPDRDKAIAAMAMKRNRKVFYLAAMGISVAYIVLTLW